MSQPRFVVGQRYRVRRDFKSLRDRFVEGECMTYHSTAWSRYDGITGYFFEQPDKDYLRVWDVPDDGPAPDWEELFELVAE